MLAKILIPVTSLSWEDEVRAAADRAKPEGRPKARATSLLIPALPPVGKVNARG
jgi:hypothetical protein